MSHKVFTAYDILNALQTAAIDSPEMGVAMDQACGHPDDDVRHLLILAVARRFLGTFDLDAPGNEDGLDGEHIVGEDGRVLSFVMGDNPVIYASMADYHAAIDAETITRSPARPL